MYLDLRTFTGGSKVRWEGSKFPDAIASGTSGSWFAANSMCCNQFFSRNIECFDCSAVMTPAWEPWGSRFESPKFTRPPQHSLMENAITLWWVKGFFFQLNLLTGCDGQIIMGDWAAGGFHEKCIHQIITWQFWPRSEGHESCCYVVLWLSSLQLSSINEPAEMIRKALEITCIFQLDQWTDYKWMSSFQRLSW